MIQFVLGNLWATQASQPDIIIVVIVYTLSVATDAAIVDFLDACHTSAARLGTPYLLSVFKKSFEQSS